jgi:Na+/melibiose symporter-like transporter
MNFRRYFFFLCGQIGMMSLARFFFQWIQKFAAAENGPGNLLFPATAVGTALLAFRIFDGVTDPLAGSLSDSWVRGGKKRQNLLWFSILIPSIGLILCFLPKHDMLASLRWSLLLGGMFAFFVGYTFYAIPFWSLVDDYAPGDVKTRTILSNLIGAGTMLATAIAFVVSPALVDEDRLGFGGAAIAFGIVCALLMILPIFAHPAAEKKTNPVPGSAEHVSLWHGFGVAIRHRRFLALACLFSGSQMSLTIMTSAAAFLATDLLGGQDKDVARILGPFLAVAIPCFLLVPRISRRIGWERGMLIGSIGLAVVYLLSGVLGKGIIGGPILTAGILFAIGGPMIALLLGLEPEALVACANERGGSRYVGMYFGVFNFIVKILNGVAIFVMGLLIAWRKDVGALAVRSMSFAAGGCLVVGVVIYLCIRDRSKIPVNGEPR